MQNFVDRPSDGSYKSHKNLLHWITHGGQQTKPILMYSSPPLVTVHQPYVSCITQKYWKPYICTHSTAFCSPKLKSSSTIQQLHRYLIQHIALMEAPKGICGLWSVTYWQTLPLHNKWVEKHIKRMINQIYSNYNLYNMSIVRLICSAGNVVKYSGEKMWFSNFTWAASESYLNIIKKRMQSI